ncbi:MAG: hypothetical protein ACRC62_13170 [Microcoleus sp.]
MKELFSLGNSLLLTAALVSSLSLDIAPSTAAVLGGDNIASANTSEIIDRLDPLDIDAAGGDTSDRNIVLNQDVSSILNREINKNPSTLGEDIQSFLGTLSDEVHGAFASNSDAEFTKVVSVVPGRSQLANIPEINSIPPSQDPLKVLLKSLNSGAGSDPAKQQPPMQSYISYTDKVEPSEINPSPISENNQIAASPTNQSAKKQTYITYNVAPSSEPVKTKEVKTLAQLPSGIQGDRESFDLLQLAGGALGVGFFIWMLFQE